MASCPTKSSKSRDLHFLYKAVYDNSSYPFYIVKTDKIGA